MQSLRGVSGITAAAACWLAGIVLGKLLGPPLWLALGLAAVLLLASIFWRRYRAAPLLLLFIALGMARLALPAGAHSLQHLLSADPSFQQPIAGEIVAGPAAREYTFRYELKLTRIAGKPVHGRVLFYAPRGDLRPGDRISSLASVQRVWRRANFATFDFEESLAARGVYGVAFARGVVSLDARGRGPRAWLAAAREWLGRRIDARCADYAPFVRSILLGDASVDDAGRETLRRAGLAHLLAVSGLHVGLLWMVFWLLTRLVAPRPAARIISLALLVLYAALCAWRPSVTRAVVMLGVMTAGSLWQRRQTLLHSLGLAAFIVTLVQPRQLFSPGFQLSYLAVLALAVFVPAVQFTDKDSTRWRRLLQWAVNLAVSSLGIALALAPVTLHHFHSASFNGVLANLVALPLFALLLPAAMLAVLAPAVPLLTPALQSAFFLLADALHVWSGWLAQAPLVWENTSASAWRGLVWLVGLYCVGATLRGWKRRRRVWLGVAGVALLAAALVPTGGGRSMLRITFVDAGMADMALLETPDGHVIAIDTGPPGDVAGHVTQSLAPYLAQEGIATLDAMFITHAHEDHYGGARALCELLDVRRIIVGDETAARLPLLDTLRVEEGCELTVLRDTTTFHWGEARLRVLHPDSLFRAELVNDESLVLRLDYHEFSALFTGDIEAAAEQCLLARQAALLDCDVLKVPHHGSATSSSPAFIGAVSPEYAFIPVPKRNRHHLPDAITLDRLALLGDNLYIAGEDGALRIDTDGRRALITSMLRDETIEDASLD